MDATVAEIHQHIVEAYSKRILRGEDGLEHKLRPGAVAYERGQFLAQAMLRAGAVRTLETGCGSGLSALSILEATLQNDPKAATHVIMDPEQDSFFQGMGKRLLKDAHVWDRVEFYLEPSQLAMPRLVAAGRVFDAVYIDGDHKFDGVFCDAYYAHRLLKPGGILVIDDVWMDAVYLVCHFLEESYRYENCGELRSAYSSAGADASIDESFTYGKAKNRPSIRAYRKPPTDVAEDDSFNLPFSPIRAEMPGDVVRRRANDLSREALVALSKGDSRAARELLLRAIRIRPLRAKNYLRLTRTLLPSRLARALGGKTHRSGDPHSMH
jgi:predicted O-methyltransferase YrrM